MRKLWEWIEYNRFVVIVPIMASIVWIVAVGCTPTVISPFDPGIEVTATELARDYDIWLKQNEATLIAFEAAGKDLERQREAQAEFLRMISTLASGGVADLPGLIQLLAGGSLIGAVGDNIRKRGLIAGLKRNGPQRR